MSTDPSLPARRRLLVAGLGFVGAALAALTAWPFWRYLNPGSAAEEEKQAIIDRSLIEVGGAHFFQFRGQAAVVVQPSPGTFHAHSAVCTHLGCIVTWRAQEQIFFCPCHAGRFSPEGKVLGGPPPRPLETYPVTLDGNRILVG